MVQQFRLIVLLTDLFDFVGGSGCRGHCCPGIGARISDGHRQLIG